MTAHDRRRRAQRKQAARDPWEVWRDRLWTIFGTLFVAVLIWLDFANDGAIQNQWLFVVLAAYGSGATTWFLYTYSPKRGSDGEGDGDD